MSADHNNKDKSKAQFTVDSDRTGASDMPSITKLLNRKSLTISSGSENPPPPFESDQSGISLAVVSPDFGPSILIKSPPEGSDIEESGITLTPVSELPALSMPEEGTHTS